MLLFRAQPVTAVRCGRCASGVIGLEYASMFNVIPGVRVTVIDGRPDVLTFADKEVIQSLEYEMRQKGARFLLGEEVLSAKIEGGRVVATLAR
jgi:NAD(P) transhydrogenase